MNKINQILAQTSNRQYPLPLRDWKYYQEWHDTVFFHWKVPRLLLEEFIPEELELDTFNNIAWVSLVAFEVKNMRMRNLPVLPFISHFHEINIRTYVIKDGVPGIYLFSIETDKFIEVLFSRLFIGLPYQKSEIIRNETSLLSDNITLNSHLNIEFNKVSFNEKTTLDFWLSERHALYEKGHEEIFRFDVHHPEWQLQKLNAKILKIKYNAGKYTLNSYPDKIHYSKKAEVILWGKKIV
jgi:uncharacterized protein YqjF (DUF2071 family)